MFYKDKVLLIKDEEFNFNLDSGRWIEEISKEHLIDNNGYFYTHGVLD